ncbi:MAG TPA: hypothetical protein VNW29_05175 [Candidatus Sulfotelmatobacter sp.]|jgi:hypothetical protein|nr:hypothetical protein [Candidatus Sulfotelmatobacter sp.]
MNSERLTGFSQSGYNGTMEAPVLDRPLMDQPEQKLEMRNKIKELYYAKAVREREGANLPENTEKLRELLDRHVEELAAKSEAEGEVKQMKDIPDFVLRQENDWSRIGWRKEDREAVIAKLKDVLHLDIAACTHALESIVGAGLTPREALEKISSDVFNRAKEFFKTPEPQEGQQSQQEVSDEEATLRAQTNILRGMGVKDEYIKRFILNEGYQDALQAEFDTQLPNNLFDLAWNIGFENKTEFGLEGRFPVLQMQVQRVKEKDENGNIVEKVKGRYVVNQANFMQWMRLHIWRWYDEIDTDELTDYFSKIEIKKGPYYTVNLITMIFNRERYFKDEEGVSWDKLWDQTLLEPWMMMNIRQYYLDYEKAMNSEEKLAEMYNNDFFLSKLTRKIYGKGMVNLLMTLPVDYEGKDSDTRLGEAWSKMFMAYYNMCDFEELQKVLGKDSSFFRRSGWEKAIHDINKGIVGQTGMPTLGKFLGEKEKAYIEAFTGKDGKLKDEIQDQKKFITFVNMFPNPVAPSTAVQVVDQALQNAVKDMLYSKEANLNSEKVDKKNDLTAEGKLKAQDYLIKYAWLIAHTFTLFTGAAARNNYPAVSGHNAETKWQRTREYRKKYIGYGGGGNPFTVNMFKQLSIPFMEGVLLENAYDHYVYEYDANGKPKWGERNKTPMEIFNDLNAKSEEWDSMRRRLKDKLAKTPEDNKAERDRILQELDRVEELSKNEYKMLAGQLEFNQDAMRNYAQNIIGRGRVLYETLMGAKEIDFDKFCKYDGMFRGISFDRAAWQKELQGGLITPLRYLFDANGATQLNMLTRAPDENGNMQTMTLAEAMMGHQVLDVPELRTQRKDLTPEKWKAMKQLGYRQRGKYIIRPDGKHDINYNKVQENKRMVYKQWMLMKLAGDLWQHISRHSTDPAYGMSHYMNVLDAIINLPGGMDGNEFDMQGARVTKAFFEKWQIQWLKKISGTTTTSLFNREFWINIFVGDNRKKESIFGESFSILMSAIFRGVK